MATLFLRDYWKIVCLLIASIYVLCSADIAIECGIDDLNETGEVLHHRTRRESSAPDYNDQSRFIKIVLVYDNEAFKQQGSNITVVREHVDDVEMHLNELFAPLNIFVTVVWQVIWTKTNALVTTNYGSIYNALPKYRQACLVRAIDGDYTHMISGNIWDYRWWSHGSQMCVEEDSIGYSSYAEANHCAVDIAGAIGYSLGMVMDTVDCSCPEERCLRDANSNDHQDMKYWSSCSFKHWSDVLADFAKFPCLRNKPKMIIEEEIQHEFKEKQKADLVQEHLKLLPELQQMVEDQKQLMDTLKARNQQHLEDTQLLRDILVSLEQLKLNQKQTRKVNLAMGAPDLEYCTSQVLQADREQLKPIVKKLSEETQLLERNPISMPCSKSEEEIIEVFETFAKLGSPQCYAGTSTTATALEV